MLLGSRIITAIVVVVGVPAATVAYVALIEWVLGRIPFIWRRRLRPWLWAGPAFAFLGVYLVYPMVYTFILSFKNYDSSKFVGIENYKYVFTNPSSLTTLRNNLYWLVLLAGAVVILGFIFAVLFDRVRYEPVVKGMIFLPMAISFVAAGVVWKLQYDYRPPGVTQTGTFDAIITALGGQPVAWLVDRSVNNFALILVGVWMWTGYGMVILSAGLKGIPTELIEAARVDGASEIQILFRIIIPIMASTIAVVATTMIINALKAFAIVYTMTSGNFGTDIMANQMYKQMFLFNNFGVASAVAVVLLVATVPVMLINIRRFRAQEELR
ncbi:MAG: carbohydrate ABC transporter permease [Anaerolineae bacterium]|jgi:alpha-glucoside transport system permease protein